MTDNKLIICTTALIRGDLQRQSMGKFYKEFNQYLQNYEIYHIINIDQPNNLKKYFSIYETLNMLNEIIPQYVNKIYITPDNPGFLNAYKNIMTKIEEMDLINDNYLYYWFEDDWECQDTYDIFSLCRRLSINKNSAFTTTINTPLGSFRGGPFMNGSYFKNIFNIRQYMNDTCDPERQVVRWLRGGDYKNGHKKIYRLGSSNDTIDNSKIQIIIVYLKNHRVSLHDLLMWTYSKYDSAISFDFFITVTDINFENIQFSKVNYKTNEYKLQQISFDDYISFFNNKYIKYYTFKPKIFEDIGRKFGKQYNLVKWSSMEDKTSYTIKNTYDACLGNWVNYEIDYLRCKPNITMNKGFFSSLAYIHQCLPYLDNKYFKNDIKLNIKYYSHNYGNYPNFEVIGDLITLNYIPSENQKNIKHEELQCLSKLCKNICGTQETFDINELQTLYSYKDNFTVAKNYLFKFFKINDEITNEVTKYTQIFMNKQVLGIHFRGTDKNRVKWVQHVSSVDFIRLISYHLSERKYDIIFISTDEKSFIELMEKEFIGKYQVIYYDKDESDNTNAIHINRLTIMTDLVKEMRNVALDKRINLEMQLKEESIKNRNLLKNLIINSFILSKCNTVLKTHSQVSAYAKVYNPDLEIYRVNGCITNYWPDSHIPLYPLTDITDENIKALLYEKTKNEVPTYYKDAYKNMDQVE